MSEAKLIRDLNYKSEKLFSVIDAYDSHISPIKEKNPSKYNKIMTQVYEDTHKSTLSGKKLDNWIENFPNMIDRKMEAEKRKLKEKTKSPKKVKASKRVYIMSPFRNQNILNKMDKLGYYSINTESKMDKMKAGLKDDEIIADLVEEISDPLGGDHDMVEINYDKQFESHLETYKERYKYVYAVEDVKPKKKDVLIRKDVISVPKKPKVEIKKKRPVKITPIKKKKLKLYSSIILSENPIKITPVEELEHIKKKPTIKKKPIKKVPIKKKTVKKKKPVVKRKPIVTKKTAKKKKPVKRAPIKKKKPTVRKKLVKKKKPLPKVKSTRAKRRGSPITGRWTARYRVIKGERRKIKIRRWKGNIQTRIIK